MPNWCACELIAEGTETDVTAFVDGFRAAFASPGNYETVSAMIHCDEDGARHVAAVQTPFACTANEFSVTPDGKQRINCLFEPEYDVSDNHANIQFTSKWRLPWEEADLVRMSAAFPALKIIIRYAEQGLGFVGSYTLQYGAVQQWERRSVRDDERLETDDDYENHYQGEYAELLAKSG